MPTKTESPEKIIFSFENSPHKKGTCPACNQKYKFRYFKNLPREYGKCERVNECGYFNDPHKLSIEQKKELNSSTGLARKTEASKPPAKILRPGIAEKKLLQLSNSVFHKFCIEQLKVPAEHLQRWNVGTKGATTVFGYCNKNGELLNLKFIDYALVQNKNDCKRVKVNPPYYLKAAEGTKYERCLFGEHLLRDGKIVCLVESEKTAVLASWFYRDTDFDFVATGGSNAMPDGYSETLLSKKIYFITDNDFAGKENSTINKLKGLDFQILDLFKDRAKGWDLGDELISGKIPEIKPATIIFYSPVYKFDQDSGRNTLIDVRINYTEWIELLYSFGFRRFDIDKTYTFIRIQQQIISEVEITHIQDFFISYLKSLPEKLDNGIPRKMLIDKFFKSPSHYFNEGRLTLLNPDQKIIFNSDTKDEAYIYFLNGFAKIDKTGWQLFDYNKLNGYIWRDQQINKVFRPIDPEKMDEHQPLFARFMYNISGQIQSRFDSLCTIAGYNLHTYFEGKLKATLLTDSSISDDNEGRTGKTLFVRGLGQIKKYVEIPGKRFDPKDKHRYSQCKLDTQIIHLNDAVRHLDFEVLYNDITEGVTIDEKNEKPYNLLAKFIVSTNKTIKLDGASSRDRSIEFELADYYSDKLSPQDEFKQWFFRDWDTDEWNKFYNFMMSCLCSYFNKGLISPQEINLNKRKLLDQTCSEFVDFMAQEFAEIKYGDKLDRKEMHERFLTAYPEFREDKYRRQLKNFTKYLVIYSRYTKGIKEIKKGIDYERSNNMNWVIFSKDE